MVSRPSFLWTHWVLSWAKLNWKWVTGRDIFCDSFSGSGLNRIPFGFIISSHLMHIMKKNLFIFANTFRNLYEMLHELRHDKWFLTDSSDIWKAPLGFQVPKIYDLLSDLLYRLCVCLLLINLVIVCLSLALSLSLPLLSLSIATPDPNATAPGQQSLQYTMPTAGFRS